MGIIAYWGEKGNNGAGALENAANCEPVVLGVVRRAGVDVGRIDVTLVGEI